MTVGDDGRIPVLFLGGFGRSGSTLLERMVGELPGVVPLGEVVHLWERALRDDQRCGCGQPFSACPFWSAVGDAAFGGWHTVDAEDVLRLKSRVDRNRFVPRLAAPRLRAGVRADLERYVDLYARVYAAALEVSGAQIVVDSSKHVSLAFCLRWCRRVDLKVAHMVRDSPGVVYSWSKEVARPEVVTHVRNMPRYGLLRSSLSWVGFTTMYDVLAALGSPTILVRYEDVVSAPRDVLRHVAAHGGLAVTAADLAFVHGNRISLSGTHTVAGNPMRFVTGDLVLSRDDAWRTGLSRRKRVAVEALTFPVRVRLGYAGAGRSTRSPAQRQGALRMTVEDAQRPADRAWPSVSVVVATRDRPELLAVALDAIRRQDYPGRVETIVVHDQSDVDLTRVLDDPLRPVRVISNVRTTGLAGARNSGIDAASSDLVAFCDDDDSWQPAKLTTQVAALEAVPGSVFVTCGIRVTYGDTVRERPLDMDRVTMDDLLRSRLTELHPSTFLIERRALVERIGLVDEEIPGSYAEDYELLLRAARVHPIVHVSQILVDVLWHKKSFFVSRWDTIASALTWLLERYPEFTSQPAGEARIKGQIAFAHASAGRRREAARWSVQAVRSNPREGRAYLALLVATKAARSEKVLAALHRRGRGI